MAAAEGVEVEVEVRREVRSWAVKPAYLAALEPAVSGGFDLALTVVERGFCFGVILASARKRPQAEGQAKY